MRIGIVAEGVSEFLVIEEIFSSIDPRTEVVRLWPDTSVGGRPYGWRGVRRWCQDISSSGLAAFMKGVRGSELDGLVVHLDCSMAHNLDIEFDCPPARKTANALRKVILEDWLRLKRRPAWLLLVAPAQTTEAWVVAALKPTYKLIDNIECEDAEKELVTRRHLRRKRNGEVKKTASKYRPLVGQMIREWSTVQKHCREAARFYKEAMKLLL